MGRDQLDRKWQIVTARHDAAVESFVAGARAVPAERWERPIGEGKWTPAQITQHVLQTYEVLISELRTGEGLTVRTGWATRQVLRLVVLRPIMWLRRIPSGAKAPRPIRPREDGLDQAAAVARLEAVVCEFNSEIVASRDRTNARLTHHLFGSVDTVDGLDFVAVHTEHHGRQLR